VAASRTLALAQSWIDALALHADAHFSNICAFSGAVEKGHANAVSVYGWTGHKSGSGFSDLAPSILHYNWF
jgi:hypothetical protein